MEKYGLTLLGLALVSCENAGASSGNVGHRVASSSGSIVDAAHGGRDGFYWLPPLVPEPTVTGIFDASLEPTLTVCVLDGDVCAADVALFPFGTGRGTVRRLGDAYAASWAPPPGAVADGPYYRARVEVDGVELGSLDLQIVRSGRDLRVVPDDLVGIVQNRAVPFRFRVEVGATVRRAALPTAPSADLFMWQGQQTGFVDAAGAPCGLTIAIATSDHATCFTAAGGSLLCAGQTSTALYGPAFVDAGIAGVDQVLLPGWAPAESMCVHVETGEAWCIGHNADGQLGTGDLADVAELTRWGDGEAIVALAAGHPPAFCGLTEGGDVLCAGASFGPTPVVVDTDHEAVWMGIDASVHFEDEGVFRVMSAFPSCRITGAGGECDLVNDLDVTVGEPGEVVDVIRTVMNRPGWERACWLDTAGAVTCRLYDPEPARDFEEYAAFTAMPVLTFAGHIASEAFCAVYVDGSVACSGENVVGQLGLPEPAHLFEEVVVAPPGSVDTTCR